MPPIWFYFVIAAEFLWFFIESKWLTIRLVGDVSQKSAEVKAAPPAAACPPAQAPAQAQTQAPSETQPKV